MSAPRRDGTDVFERVESMFEHYRMNCLRREALRLRLGPKSASVVPLGKRHVEGWSDEGRACELADVDAEIRRCRLCLRALTRQERWFVEARYWNSFTMRQVARDLGVSVREAYRLRQSVVVKSAFVLGWCTMR